MIIELPWPPTVLNPNSIAHWGKKARAKKKYLEDCWKCAKAAGKPKFAPGRIFISLAFYPPTKHRRDQDNLIASMKSGLDGLAKAWGVDDSSFKLKDIHIGEVVKGGKVIVEAL